MKGEKKKIVHLPGLLQGMINAGYRKMRANAFLAPWTRAWKERATYSIGRELLPTHTLFPVKFVRCLSKDMRGILTAFGGVSRCLTERSPGGKSPRPMRYSTKSR